MNDTELLQSIRLKFKSGNDVPVTRAALTREEYMYIERLVARTKELEPVTTIYSGLYHHD